MAKQLTPTKRPRAQIIWYPIKSQATGETGWRTNEFEWHLLLIERKDRIPTLKERVYQATAPIQEQVQLTSGNIHNTNLSYELYRLTTRGSPPSKMSQSKELSRMQIRQDRALRQRSQRGILEDYVDTNIRELSLSS